MGFIITFLINVVSFAVLASGLLPGIKFVGEWPIPLAISALVFAFVNALIKPILKFLTCPFILLTLGLFLFVINAAMLMLTSGATRWLDETFNAIPGYLFIENFWWAVLGSIIMSVLGVFLGWLLDKDGTRGFRRQPKIIVQQTFIQQRTDYDREFDAFVRSQQQGGYPPAQYPPQMPPGQYPQQPPPQQYPPQQYPPQQPYPPQYPPAQYPPAQPYDPNNPYGQRPPPPQQPRR